MWYCDMCEEDMKITTKRKHLNSDTYIHRSDYTKRY